jgi:hypothetical protein
MKNLLAKMENPLGKMKIRSVEMENPLGKNKKSARLKWNSAK